MTGAERLRVLDPKKGTVNVVAPIEIKDGVITGVPDEGGITGVVYWSKSKQLVPYRSQLEVCDHTLGSGFFGWGNGTTGAFQLAAAILLEVTSKEEAKARHMKFSEEVIEKLPFDQKFELPIAKVEKWLQRHRGSELQKAKR